MYKEVYEDGLFHVRSGEEPVYTPAGNPITTDKRALAEKLAEHFTQFGESAENKYSLAYFHCTMLDFIRYYPRESIIQQLLWGFDPLNDWTFRCRSVVPEVQQRWIKVFGEHHTRREEGVNWINTLNEYQQCAVIVFSKAMKSLNIAYLAASCDDHKQLCRLIRNITLFNPRLGQEPLEELIDNYLFYFKL